LQILEYFLFRFNQQVTNFILSKDITLQQAHNQIQSGHQEQFKLFSKIVKIYKDEFGYRIAITPDEFLKETKQGSEDDYQLVAAKARATIDLLQVAFTKLV